MVQPVQTRIALSFQSSVRATFRYICSAIYYFFTHLSFRPGGDSNIVSSRPQNVKDTVDVYKEQVRGGAFYDKYKKEIATNYQASTKDLFEVPLATIASWGERHAVSLLFDKKAKIIFVLDTKGYEPAKLKLEAHIVGKRALESVQDFINAFSNELELTNWQEQTTCFSQKPRDCIFTVEALVRGLAKQETRDLASVQQNMHNNYSTEVDTLRATFFSKK